jgi:hypothetical protein
MGGGRGGLTLFIGPKISISPPPPYNIYRKKTIIECSITGIEGIIKGGIQYKDGNN